MPTPFLTRHRNRLRFAAWMTGAYAAWYLLYDGFLLPDGRLDHWLSLRAVESASALLSMLGLDVLHAGRVFWLAATAAHPASDGILVVNGCNGLSSIGLFVGFVLAFPGRWVRRAWFLPAGMLIVYAANVGRLALLGALQRYWEAGFTFVHDLGATAVFYAVIFALWVAWAHVGSGAKATPPPPSHRSRAQVLVSA